MRIRASSVSAAVWLAVISGGATISCGADDRTGFADGDEGPETPIAVQLATTSQALFADLSFVQVQLHSSDVSCEVLAVSGPDYRSPYRLEIDLQAGRSEGTLFDVTEGDYTVDAWGFGADVDMHGCERPVPVQRGQLTEVSITLDVVGP